MNTSNGITQTPVAWAYVNDEGECEQIEWGMENYSMDDDSKGLIKLYQIAASQEEAAGCAGTTEHSPVIVADRLSCLWVQDSDGIWNTNCGVAFEFNEGLPKDNHANFCHNCGKPLIADAYIEEDNDETGTT